MRRERGAAGDGAALWWLVRRFVVRNVPRRPLAGLMTLASVAVGVAVFVAVQTASHSVARSFEEAVDAVAGRADLEVTGLAGRFGEGCFPAVAGVAGVEAATPITRGMAGVAGRPGERVEIVGTDLFTNGAFYGGFGDAEAGGEVDLEVWLGGGGVVLAPEVARRLGVGRGGVARLVINGRVVETPVAGVWAPEGVDGGMFGWMDIGWAQERFGFGGWLSGILVKAQPGADAGAVREALEGVIPPEARVGRPARRTEQVLRMTAGFRLNLQAMSGVSLLVGAFLIYSAVAASVVRRRAEIGMLRAAGLGRRGVRWLFLAEALVTGLPGIPLGLVLGLALGNGLLGAVSATVSSLYAARVVEGFYVPWGQLWLAALAGAGAVLAGAWLPAREAAGVDPAEALRMGSLREKAGSRARVILPVAAAGCVAGAGVFSWAALETGPAWLGFVSAFFVLAAGACVVPGVTGLAGLAAARAGRRLGRVTLRLGRVTRRLAGAGVTRSLHRLSVTGGALCSAVALATGVAVMIHSFRQSVELWARQVAAADVFVGLEANETAGAEAFLPEGLVSRLAGLEGVAAVETYSRFDAEVEGLLVDLAVTDGADRGRFRFIGGRPGHFARWLEGESVIVSESAARRLGVAEGGEVRLPTPGGLAGFRVAGVFRDYTSDKGVVMMRREVFERLWGEARAQSAALYLEGDEAERERVAGEIAERLGAEGAWEGLRVFTNAGLRKQIRSIFDQTFAVTYALRYVAMVVALAGVLFSLSTLVIERGRELALLRAQGLSRGGAGRHVVWESQIVALAASVTGLVTGLGLAVVLTWVINRAFFGWTIDWAVPWGLLAQTPVWAGLSALVAALWPALRARGLSLARALREE